MVPYESAGSSDGVIIKVCLALILIALAAYALGPARSTLLEATQSLPHADLQHGKGTLSSIKDCNANGGHYDTMRNAETGNIADICQFPDGRWALLITDKNGNDVTGFFKEKLKWIEDVKRYLTNRGYGQ